MKPMAMLFFVLQNAFPGTKVDTRSDAHGNKHIEHN